MFITLFIMKVCKVRNYVMSLKDYQFIALASLYCLVLM